MRNFLTIAAAMLTLAACNAEPEGNAALAEANASGNQASAAVENAIAQSPATPLAKDQALAMMKERHENYERIGKAMKAAKRGLDNDDAAAVRTAAATINGLAPKAASWFPAGTGPDVGKTHAKAEIWQKPEDFAAKAKGFADAAAAFDAAARGSDMAAAKSSFGKLGESCKACHDSYRAKVD